MKGEIIPSYSYAYPHFRGGNYAKCIHHGWKLGGQLSILPTIAIYVYSISFHDCTMSYLVNSYGMPFSFITNFFIIRNIALTIIENFRYFYQKFCSLFIYLILILKTRIYINNLYKEDFFSPWHVEVPRAEIEPTPQQWAEPPQYHHQILHLPHHKRTQENTLMFFF